MSDTESEEIAHIFDLASLLPEVSGGLMTSFVACRIARQIGFAHRVEDELLPIARDLLEKHEEKKRG